MIINKSKKYKKQFEKYQQLSNFFDKFYRKSLQDNSIDKEECESQWNLFTKEVDKTKNFSFLKMNIKIINFFSSNKINSKLESRS